MKSACRIVVLNFLLSPLLSWSQGSFDSLDVKLPKHYFNTVLSADYFAKPQVALDTVKRISRKLGSYSVRQSYLNFYTPIWTKVEHAADGTISNHHLLLTANYVSMTPHFTNIADHRLTYFSVGVRYIYNTGKKGVLFIDASPFVTRDVTQRNAAYRRFAGTIVYSVNESDVFNWRIGVTKTFMWGNRYYLPYIGFRFGRLDGFNVSIQFPRNININVPLSRNVRISAFSRPQGGVFLFSNRDTTYPKLSEKNFLFTQYEVLTGLRLDVRIGQRVLFYFSTGFSTGNFITFYSEPANRRLGVNPYYKFFYDTKTKGTVYLNLGLVLKFGRARTILKDRNMNDAVDMNNINEGNIQIQQDPKRKSRENIQSIMDMVDYNDL